MSENITTLLSRLIFHQTLRSQNKFCNRVPYNSVCDKDNQRTNGPLNAHLRSAAYTNKRV